MIDHTQQDLEQGRKALLAGGVGAQASFTVLQTMGSLVWDTEGKEYVDCTAQAWSLSIGHSHPAVVAAVTEQMRDYTHIRTSFDTVPKLLLAKKIAELAPGSLNKVAFSLSGSDAMEGAMKLALRNSTSQDIVSLHNGFHGRTLATMRISWPHPEDPFHQWSKGPVVRISPAYCYRCPLSLKFPSCQFACVTEAKKHIQQSCSEPPAAIVMEPVQGNGGMVDFPNGYHQKMRDLATELGALLVWDEIQTCMGRLGAWFGADLYGVEPDIMVIGKGLGGGLPIFATVVSDNVKELFHSGDHSFTFAHFPLSMVAALATVKVIEEENLVERSAILGAQIKAHLLYLQTLYPDLIGEVRGPGLMLGLEIVKDAESRKPSPTEAHQIVQEGIKRGVIFGESKYAGLGNVVKIKPPLNIPQSLVGRALAILEECLRVVSSGRK